MSVTVSRRREQVDLWERQVDDFIAFLRVDGQKAQLDFEEQLARILGEGKEIAVTLRGDLASGDKRLVEAIQWLPGRLEDAKGRLCRAWENFFR